MKNKKIKNLFVILALSTISFTGCANTNNENIENETVTNASEIVSFSEVTETIEDTSTQEQNSEMSESPQETLKVSPLPDTTMDNLDNSTFAISLEEADAYVDDSGVMQMNVKIYTYDKYDMVDISMLKEGDTIVIQSNDVVINSITHNDYGTLFINGGIEEGGYELFSDDSGVYFEMGFSDIKSWYEVGEAQIRVSDEFEFKDLSDLDNGEVTYYPGDFLTDAIPYFNFTPHNTKVRTENGQIVYMERIFTP